MELGIHDGLAAAEEHHRALAASLPAGFLLLYDDDLRFRVAGGPDLGLTGLRAADFEGHLLEEVVHETVLAECRPHYRAALAGHRASWERETPRGALRLTAAPLLDAAGEPLGGIVLGQDVTEERRTQHMLSALHGVALAVARKTDPLDVAWRITRDLVSVFGARSAGVMRYLDDHRVQTLTAAPQMVEGLDPVVPFSPGDGTSMAGVWESGQATRAVYCDDGNPVVQTLLARGIAGTAAAPIHLDGELWGLVVVAVGDAAQLGDTFVQRLRQYGELVELALSSSEAWGALEREASEDELTGLANRRSFCRQLDLELERAQRDGSALSLVLLDVDHFKAVNDTHGHAVGDRVLRELARRLGETVRDGEVVGRLGGEEFAWLLPGTDAHEAREAAERMRRGVAARPVEGVGRVTVSVGVTTSDPCCTGEGLLRAADTAMYAAKRTGRDRVVSQPHALVS